MPSPDATLLSKELLHHFNKTPFQRTLRRLLALTPNRGKPEERTEKLPCGPVLFPPSKKEVSLQTGKSSSRDSHRES